MDEPRVASSVWSSGGASTTVTDWLAVPNCNLGFNPKVPRASTTMCSWVKV